MYKRQLQRSVACCVREVHAIGCVLMAGWAVAAVGLGLDGYYDVQACVRLPGMSRSVGFSLSWAVWEVVSVLRDLEGEGAERLNQTAGLLLDASGRHFVPPVLRVGPNIRESLSHVSLDSLARKRQMEAGDALTYEAARSLVLVEARIVCTTLSCAGHKDFASLRFDTVIIDEGHRLKNETSRLCGALGRVQAPFRILLTGTPLQNSMHELWALLNFLFPDVFPDSTAFDDAFDRGKGGKQGLSLIHI